MGQLERTENIPVVFETEKGLFLLWKLVVHVGFGEDDTNVTVFGFRDWAGCGEKQNLQRTYSNIVGVMSGRSTGG